MTTDYPALDGRTVTEAHTRICRETGHASHTVDGVDSGMCPRCGDVTPRPALYRVTRYAGALSCDWCSWHAAVKVSHPDGSHFDLACAEHLRQLYDVSELDMSGLVATS